MENLGKKLPRKLINYTEGKRMLPPSGTILKKPGFWQAG